LKNVFSCKCTKDLFLFILDKVMEINGDGIVSENPQKVNSTRTINMKCSHANSLKKEIEIIEKL